MSYRKVTVEVHATAAGSGTEVEVSTGVFTLIEMLDYPHWSQFYIRWGMAKRVYVIQRFTCM